MISVQDIGGPTVVAKMVRLSVPSVHGWKAIPERHCPVIERATGGDFTCEEMRPDVVWQRLADAAWPHPKGRPLLDFAAEPTQPPALTHQAQAATDCVAQGAAHA